RQLHAPPVACADHEVPPGLLEAPCEAVGPAEAHAHVDVAAPRGIRANDLQVEGPREEEIALGDGEHLAGDDVHRVPTRDVLSAVGARAVGARPARARAGPSAVGPVASVLAVGALVAGAAPAALAALAAAGAAAAHDPDAGVHAGDRGDVGD